MKKILLAGQVPQDCIEMLENKFELFKLYEAANRDAFLLEHGDKIDGVTGGRIDAELISQLPNLKVIANYGVGYDNVDVGAASTRGIRVSNTPNRLNAAVAELTVGLMVSLAREIPSNHAYVKSGRWASEGQTPLTAQLAGARVGILGLGRIGKAIAVRLTAFDMEVSYHGRTHQKDQPYHYFDDLTDMAKNVDWLVVIAPGGEGTHKIITREVLQALGANGSFVNIARGNMVDQDALIDLLSNGGLRGAALDVFDGEPEVPEALRMLDNVILSPHKGSATRQTRAQMSSQVVENLVAYFEKGELLDPVI
ncbi:2-hydroxyacid dehydrogenase [Maritalea porphyrae]|uniref:D-2-hydroxyacid dehydrogenase n=1 Tax=Maritalea porphyrae TaxID=880732 RepID=A0ABQ5UQW3_9HYPH|nr:2-hydroxyacid dehydrogenase [Maritalea porphyrae]GLQ17651.1 D-2-hydroxyacid dehydrogenase [Maritalea porphyrae]